LQPLANGSRQPQPYDPAIEQDLPTVIVRHPQRQRGRQSGGWFRWARTLRWRLALSYIGTLALLLLILGIVLDIIVGSALLQEERARFSDEVVASITVNQHFFDREVNGTGKTCAGAISYQQAFQESIAQPLSSSHPAIRSVYLLDRNGFVQAPESATAPVGEQPPYFTRANLESIRAKVATAPKPGTTTGYITSEYYETQDSNGQRLGVMLVAIRYYTSSPCAVITVPGVHASRVDLGIVQVVTDYARLRGEMAVVHLVLIATLFGALLLGVLVGGPLIVRSLRPLTRMTETARRIASGDLTQRVRLPHGGDEIGQLADTFDEMISRIERAFAAQHASEDRMRQFIADASHELRTPLTSIRGYTDVLLRGAKDDPETAEQVLRATQREAERMTRLVNDLLTLARLDAGRPLELQSLDLLALVGEAVDQARILAGEREVTMRSDGGGRLMVLADPDRMKQVLLILLDNALKYGRQDASGWVRVQVGRTQRGAFVSISDNGIGIAPADLPHVFDRFYRAQRGDIQRRIASQHVSASGPNNRSVARLDDQQNDQQQNQRPPKREGSGLGLSIAQAIVRAHGGALTVESTLGAGTTFTIQLPLPEQAPPSLTPHMP
jgi:two-component system OmpR family sensor kinase